MGESILESDRVEFKRAIERFKNIIQQYQVALHARISEAKAEFKERIVREFALKWEKNPPPQMKKFNPTPISIRTELERQAHVIFDKAVSFETPKIRVLYKRIAPETTRDAAFLEPLEAIMAKKWVPKSIIETLFETGQTAPETGAFEPD